MTRKIVVTGDSHLTGLINAVAFMKPDFSPRIMFRGLGGANSAPLDFFRHDAQNGTVQITLEQWENVQFPIAGDDGELCRDALYAVSMACSTTRFLRDYDWSCYVPWHLRRSPHEIALSDQVIGRIIAADTAKPIAFMQALIAIGLDACVIEAPRHFAHAPYIKSMRPDVLAHLTQTYLDHVLSQLARQDIAVIRLPDDAIGKDGATLPEYRLPKEGDDIHANRFLGIRMLEKVVAHADRAGHKHARNPAMPPPDKPVAKPAVKTR